MLSSIKKILLPIYPANYSKEKAKADIIESCFNSSINSLIFGFCHGSLYAYT